MYFALDWRMVALTANTSSPFACPRRMHSALPRSALLPAPVWCSTELQLSRRPACPAHTPSLRSTGPAHRLHDPTQLFRHTHEAQPPSRQASPCRQVAIDGTANMTRASHCNARAACRRSEERKGCAGCVLCVKGKDLAHHPYLWDGRRQEPHRMPARVVACSRSDKAWRRVKPRNAGAPVRVRALHRVSQ